MYCLGNYLFYFNSDIDSSSNLISSDIDSAALKVAVKAAKPKGYYIVQRLAFSESLHLLMIGSKSFMANGRHIEEVTIHFVCPHESLWYTCVLIHMWYRKEPIDLYISVSLCGFRHHLNRDLSRMKAFSTEIQI